MKEQSKRLPRQELLEKISKACNESFARGENVTVRKIRTAIGHGSHTTISKYINLWRDDFGKSNTPRLTRVEEVKLPAPKITEKNFEDLHQFLVDEQGNVETKSFKLNSESKNDKKKKRNKAKKSKRKNRK
jgi:hypothetical protein